ncbi:MAG TPA: DUF4019 domain-containing protein [Nitrospirota bacterium]|nr:DUF4019 domain-containing protein [Nitrospirota bacterium]
MVVYDILRIIMLLSAMTMMLSSSGAAAQAVGKEHMAVVAAEQWIALIDAGDYSSSWSEASSRFRTDVTQAYWHDTVKQFHKRLGTVVSRTLKTITYPVKLPDVPGGEYAIVRFTTSFQNMNYALETALVVRDTDGQWRMAEYFITSPLPGFRSVFTALILLTLVVAVWLMELRSARETSPLKAAPASRG